MPAVKLFLFGNPRLEHDGQPVTVRRRKGVALLAYLALGGKLAQAGQSHSRDALATLFWPEHDQSSARGNLRRELSREGALPKTPPSLNCGSA